MFLIDYEDDRCIPSCTRLSSATLFSVSQYVTLWHDSYTRSESGVYGDKQAGIIVVYIYIFLQGLPLSD